MSRSTVASSTRARSSSQTLATSTAIADHVPVDFELRGCPISKSQLLEAIGAFLQGRAPNLPNESVCIECKRRGNVCVMVAHGTPCLGSGDPGGLRGDLSGVQPGLLRLLRSASDPEHRRAHRRAQDPRDGPARGPATVPDLQRQRSRFRAASESVVAEASAP